jgi:hypothetical protein
MAALPFIAMAASLAGSVVSAAGTLAAGKAEQRAKNYEAAQLDAEAKQKQAEAQIEGERYQRKKELTLSTLQNEAGASGFSATDPTSLALADEISRYGTYQQQLAQYGGENQRAGLEAQAQGRRLTGEAERIGSRYKAVGTILGGISSMASKYNPSYG